MADDKDQDPQEISNDDTSGENTAVAETGIDDLLMSDESDGEFKLGELDDVDAAETTDTEPFIELAPANEEPVVLETEEQQKTNQNEIVEQTGSSETLSPITASDADDTAVNDIINQYASKVESDALSLESQDDPAASNFSDEDFQDILGITNKVVSFPADPVGDDTGTIENSLTADNDLNSLVANLANAYDSAGGSQFNAGNTALATNIEMNPEKATDKLQTVTVGGIDYDADIDTLIAALSGDNRYLEQGQSERHLSNEELISRIENLWQDLGRSWDVIRQQPHLVEKIEELWKLLKNSDPLYETILPTFSSEFTNTDAKLSSDDNMLSALVEQNAEFEESTLDSESLHTPASIDTTLTEDEAAILNRILDRDTDASLIMDTSPQNSHSSLHETGTVELKGDLADSEELDILVNILGDNLDVEQYKNITQHQDKSNSGDDINGPGELESNILDTYTDSSGSDSASTENTGFQLDDDLRKILHDSDLAHIAESWDNKETPESPVEEYKVADTPPVAEVHKPEPTNRISPRKTTSPATSTIHSRAIEIEETDSGSKMLPMLLVASLAALVFIIWNLMGDDEKGTKLQQAQQMSAPAEQTSSFSSDSDTDSSESLASIMARFDEDPVEPVEPATSFQEQTFIPEETTTLVEENNVVSPVMEQVNEGDQVEITEQTFKEDNSQVTEQTFITNNSPVVDLTAPLAQLTQNTNQGLENLSTRVTRLEETISALKLAIDSLLDKSDRNFQANKQQVSELTIRLAKLEASQEQTAASMARIKQDKDGVTIFLTDPADIANLRNAQGQNVKELIHVIVKGDTLWAIAKRYINNPYRYPELALLSKIKDPDRIYPGNRVRIIVKAK